MLMWFCYTSSEQTDETEESAKSSRINGRFAAVKQTRWGGA
jgi:hypothetical protein